MAETISPASTLNAPTLVKALGGRMYGRGGLCFCPAHANARTPALSVSEGRDGLILLFCHAGCSYIAIRQALEAHGLTMGNRSPDPEAIAHHQQEMTFRRDKAARRARAKWEASLPPEGTVVEIYLAHRGLKGPIPETFRYLPGEWHPQGAFDVMIAYIEGVPAPAVHLTFLGPEGEKAPVQPPRLFVGAPGGGGVCLFTGSGPLVVGEGIESTFSAAQMMPGHGEVWAALSASGMAMFQLPNKPGELVIAIDADPAGRSAGRKLGERAVACGWHVLWAEPPDGLDWNDVLRQQKGAV